MTPTSVMLPPTLSSICWPATVCCCMIAHSSSSSGPALLMISFGHGDLADVVQQRAELDEPALVLVEAHLVGDLQRQRDDAVAVLAGVRVVVGLMTSPSSSAVPR